MSESEVNQLIGKCMEDDRRAQKELYKAFFPFAMGICLRYSTSRDEASEILNEGFLKVFRNLHRFSCQYLFKSWLAKIIINTAIDHFRSNLRRTLLTKSADVETAGNEISIESKLNYHDLLTMVQQLTPAYRIIFNMFVVDGYSHDEISKILKINTGTSKSNLFKARIKLKEMILKLDGR